MPKPQPGQLKTYLDGILRPSGEEAFGLEAMSGDDLGIESIARRTALSDEQTATVKRAFEKAKAGLDMSAPEQFAIEAIIIPDKRPAIDIVAGDIVVTHPLWTKFSTDQLLYSNIKKAIPSVGRIELPDHPSLPYGGTGFVVGNNLLMTNRHVAQIFASGLGLRGLAFKSGLSAGIDFKRERDSEASAFLGVRRVVMIHPYWDMALLEVEGLAAGQAPLLLSVREPGELVDSDVAVIGYPAFDSRNDAAVQHQVFGGVYNVKRLQPGKIRPRSGVVSFGKEVDALCHDSSTLGGNSGSCVYDPQSGKIVALHFAGVYLDRNYCVPAAELARDGRVVDAGVNFEPGARGGTPDWESGWRDVGADEAAKPVAPVTVSPAHSYAIGDGATWIVPVEITVRVGAKAALSLATAAAPAPTEAMVEPAHDTNYRARPGYKPKFLGLDAPPPSPADPATVARFRNGHLIPYHHFSLALHKARRIALFTACNLDGRADMKQPYDRKTLGELGKNDMEKWFIDPRIDSAYQLPDRFFTKDKGAFDKGHIVRRDDVAWGASFREVQLANGDTFHVTNCSPQVGGFNQSAKGEDNWGDLENYVMKQAGAEKLSIFAGPVLADDDPVFVGVDDVGPVRIQIPEQYWKVIVVAAGGKLQSFAFLLRQDLSDTPLEFTVDAAWQRFMIPVADLEALNPEVIFHEAIRAADRSANPEGEAIREKLDMPVASREAVARPRP